MIAWSLKHWGVILSGGAVAIGCAWIIGTRREIAAIEGETIALEKKISTARSAEAERRSNERNAARTRQEPENEAIDWQQILSQMTEWSRGLGDNGQRERFEKHLAAMSGGELIAALNEIDRLEIPDDQRLKLSLALFPALAQKDPQSAMDRFIGKAGGSKPDQSVLTRLEYGITVWSAKDPAGAGAWLDRQITSGKFETPSLDGIHTARVGLEARMFQTMFPKYPQAAGQRIKAMPNEDAFRLIGNMASYKMAKENPATFASLARQSLTEAQSLEVIAKGASQPSMDYAAASAYLDVIHASPAEREAGVAAAADTILRKLGSSRALTLEEVDAMRAWAAPQHSAIDRLTGKVLGAAIDSDGMSSHEAANLVMHYHENGGGDDILIGFLTSGDDVSIEDARFLAAKIADPTKRAELLDHFK